MTTTRVIDGYAADEQPPSMIEPCGCILPSGPRFGEIGIAAVAGALAASRLKGAGIRAIPLPLHRLRKGAGTDAAPESLSFELSNT